MSTLVISLMIYLTARVTSSMSTKTSISDSLSTPKNRARESIILARVLYMTAFGKTTKKYKELSHYLTEIASEDFLKIILDFRASTAIKMGISTKAFGKMI